MRASTDGARSFWIQHSVALVFYVALGLFLKSVVINWIAGPLFPLIVLHLIPRAARHRLGVR